MALHSYELQDDVLYGVDPRLAAMPRIEVRAWWWGGGVGGWVGVGPACNVALRPCLCIGVLGGLRGGGAGLVGQLTSRVSECGW